LLVSEGVESKQGGARVQVPPPLVFLGLIGAGVAIQYLILPLRIPVARFITVAAGAILILKAFALVVWAGSLFRRTGQDPAPWKPSPSLVLEGPYRYTRNPMYLAMTLFQTGVGLASDDLWVVVLAPLGLALVHFLAVRPEEAYLTHKFGEPYKRYLSQVRRYL
jgi:protein-S-isoprenylcysteine O-methyltransferase Ste14